MQANRADFDVRRATWVAVMILVLLPACGTIQDVEVPVDQTLASPIETLTYLEWAYTNDRPAHVYNCLSTRLREEQGATPTSLSNWWPNVKGWITTNVGDLSAIRPGRSIRLSPRRRKMTLKSGDREATVFFVLETNYEIFPLGRTADSAYGDLDSMVGVVTYDADGTTIRLPAVDDDSQIPSSSIHRIVIENGWKIDGLGRHNLGEIPAKPEDVDDAPSTSLDDAASNLDLEAPDSLAESRSN